jgi:hypothetical protein
MTLLCAASLPETCVAPRLAVLVTAAMAWLKDQVSKTGALIGVWTMAEFQKQVNNGFLG